MNISNGTCALGEKGCFTDGKCYYNRNCENRVVTHADRIRAMSDEGLSLWLMRLHTICECCSAKEECDTMENDEVCRLGVLEWLKQPVKDGEDDD